MVNKIKSILRILLPENFRTFLWRAIPKICKINTYSLNDPRKIINLKRIDNNYIIVEVGVKDIEKLKIANKDRGKNAVKNKVIQRLESPAWKGLAVIDQNNGEIAYIAWVITNSIPYFEEFGIYLKENQFLLKDGYCVPKYRHQGLHTRMEQERINYCVRNNADLIFIQILDANIKGKDSVIKNGYVLYNQKRVIQWSLFGVYRELWSFLKSPFRKVIK